jgi:hypothetical protein
MASFQMAVCSLKATKKIAYRNLDSLCDPQESFDGNNLLSTFNLAKIFRVKVNSFGQFLLGELSLFSVVANCLTNNLPVPQAQLSFGVAHNCRKLRQNDPGIDTSNMLVFCWFFACFARLFSRIWCASTGWALNIYD